MIFICDDTLQEIESILDNPTEMADMYLGRRYEAARALARVLDISQNLWLIMIDQSLQ